MPHGVDRRQVLCASAGVLGLGFGPGLRAQPSVAAPFTDADLAHARALREAALRDRQAWALTESLVTEVGARPAGSAADARAVQWALAACGRLGLAAVRADAVKLNAWQRGPMSAELLAPHAQPLVAAALGNSVATPPEGLQAELAYYADLAALRADDTERARGRIVFIDERTERTRDGSGYGRAVLARFAGPVEAARRGAVACVIRSIGTDRDRLAHTGAMRYDPQVRQIPALAVSVPDADHIARLHARGVPMRMTLTLAARSGVPAQSANVIAEVPGTDLAREVVLLSAHLDSWDLGRGAQDDAAGVGIVAAAAALIQAAGRRPRRTIRVALFANEENGFDGAAAYAEAHQAEPHQLVGESDFGAGTVWRLRSKVRPDALPAIEALARELAPLGVAWPEAGRNEGVPGPDAGVLSRRRGWPAVELTQDGTHYFDIHHTENDTLDKIDPATLPQNVACWAVTAWLAAQSSLPFGPLPTT